MKFKQQCIQLLRVDQVRNKLVLNQETLQLISSLTKPISIISVSGVYRTGKSYLLNELLLQKPNAFEVGSTTNAQTKGIWMWGTPLLATDSDGNEFYHIIIDSQGTGSTEKDFAEDCRLLLFVLSISSTVIYNSHGAIDEVALGNFRYILEIQKQMKVGQNDSSLFPSLVWILRDFSLELTDIEGNQISQNEYLEKALQQSESNNQAQHRKNDIRRAVKRYFRNRSCFTLVRPILDEDRLQSLSSQDRSLLRPQFINKVDRIRQQIFSRIAKTKKHNNVEVSGVLLCKLMEIYIQNINSSKQTSYINIWQIVCDNTNTELFDKYVTMLEDKLKCLKLPQERSTLKKVIEEAQKTVIGQFQSKGFHNKQFQELLKELKIKTKKLKKLVKMRNEALNSEIEQQEAAVSYSKFIKPLLEDGLLEDNIKFSNSLRQFIRSLRTVTPREQLIYDKLLELCMSLNARRKSEKLEKASLLSAISQLKQQMATQSSKLILTSQLQKQYEDLQCRYRAKVTNQCEYNTAIALLEQKVQQLMTELGKQRENTYEGGEVMKKHRQDASKKTKERQQKLNSIIRALKEQNQKLREDREKSEKHERQTPDKNHKEVLEEKLRECFSKFEDERMWWKDKEEVYKKNIKTLTQSMAETERNLKDNTQMSLKQRRMYTQKQKFFEEQITQLKNTITQTKSSYEKTSQTLLRNNNVLKVIQNIKVNDLQRSSFKKQSRRALREMRDSDEVDQSYSVRKLEGEISQMRSENRRLKSKLDSLEEKLIDQRESYEKQLQQQKTQIEKRLYRTNEELTSKCKYYEIENEKLNIEKQFSTQKFDVTLQNLMKARERDRVLYEQSIRKLLVNIDRREMEMCGDQYLKTLR